MPFDWKAYLDLARYLRGDGNAFDQEAALRSAVSRAYYSAFCYARNFANANHKFTPTYKAQDHGLLRDHFRNLGMHDIADWLDDLRLWRNKCDYDDVVSNLTLVLNSAINQTEKIFSVL